MNEIKLDIEEAKSPITPVHSKQNYTSPEITQLKMNEVVKGGISGLNEAQGGALS